MVFERGSQHLRRDLSIGKGTWHGRLSALLLTISLLLPFAQLALNSSQLADAVLPACCRAHGKHKCAMNMTDVAHESSTLSSSPRLARIGEKCPYSPRWVTTAHSGPLWDHVPESFALYFNDGLSPIGPSGANRASSQSGSNHKRGPPSPALSLETANDWSAARWGLPLRWRYDVTISTDIFSFSPDAPPDSAHAA
jgi:hypothetical protein